MSVRSSPSGRRMSRSRHERPSAHQAAEVDFPVSFNVPVVEATAIAIDDFFAGSDAAAKSKAKGQGAKMTTSSGVGVGGISTDTADSSSGDAAARSRRWPQSLKAAVIESFSRPPDLQGARRFLLQKGWPSGLVEAFCLNIVKIPIRFFIVDDSGSMSTADGLKVIGVDTASKLISCTRWSELSQTLTFHAELAEATQAPTEFRLLNGSDPVVVGMGDDRGEGLAFLKQVMEEDPAGQTPLCEHVQDVVETIQSIEDSLRAKGQRAIVIIATDGLATDGNVAAALEPLKRLPVIVILRLCTNDEPVVKYWNEIDTELELEMDVLDDLVGDAKQVVLKNPWLTYNDALHKMREFGASMKEMDLIDESKLSSEQMRLMCATLLFDGKKNSLPHPDENWHGFIATLSSRMRSERQQPFCPITKKVKPWIDIKILTEQYNSSSVKSSACCIS